MYELLTVNRDKEGNTEADFFAVEQDQKSNIDTNSIKLHSIRITKVREQTHDRELKQCNCRFKDHCLHLALDSRAGIHTTSNRRTLKNLRKGPIL